MISLYAAPNNTRVPIFFAQFDCLRKIEVYRRVLKLQMTILAQLILLLLRLRFSPTRLRSVRLIYLSFDDIIFL